MLRKAFEVVYVKMVWQEAVVIGSWQSSDAVSYSKVSILLEHKAKRHICITSFDCYFTFLLLNFCSKEWRDVICGKVILEQLRLDS
jgi:hypothetical protein